MKLIHIADVHLDSALQTNLNAIKSKQRRAEIINSFERVVDYASANNVAAILICGDLLEGKINVNTNPRPDDRTEEYYKKRPCGEIVKIVADITQKHLELNKN